MDLVNDEMYSCLHDIKLLLSTRGREHATIDARQLINDLYLKLQ